MVRDTALSRLAAAFGLALVTLCGACAGHASRAPGADEPPGYDIVLVAGQSNAVGWGCGSYEPLPLPAGSDDRVFQLSRDPDPERDLQVKPAHDPLDHPDLLLDPGSRGRVGFAYTFGRILASRLPSRRRVLLVPAAAGLTTVAWWNGDAPAPSGFAGKLLPDLLRRANVALGLGAREGLRNRIVALLWHQGESDYQPIAAECRASPVDPECARRGYEPGRSLREMLDTYGRRLVTLMEKIRARLASQGEFPIVLGEIGTFRNFGVELDRDGRVLADFNAGIRAASAKIPRSAVVSSAALESNAARGCSHDTSHFSARSQVELASRYFSAFSALRGR